MEQRREQHRQETRALIMGQIRNTVKDFVETIGSTPIRLLGDTPTKILDSDNYSESIGEVARKVQDSISECRPDMHTRFLAANIFPGRHSYFVVDINNTDYDYETAHEVASPIPVYVFRLSRRPRIFRFEEQDTRLAERLAGMHEGHGYDPLPLIEDFNKIVVYQNPRKLQSRS